MTTVAALQHIFLSAVFCGLLGLEREWRNKAAGFLIHVLVGSGATLLTLMSIHGFESGDPSRLAAQMVMSIGFIGAGVIMRRGYLVRGLATAATLWMTVAIGMAVGIGWVAVAGAMTAFALAVLWSFPRITLMIPVPQRNRILLELSVPLASAAQVSELLKQQGGAFSEGRLEASRLSVAATLPSVTEHELFQLLGRLEELGATQVAWTSPLGDLG